MAAPHVAGVVAIYLQQQPKALPSEVSSCSTSLLHISAVEYLIKQQQLLRHLLYENNVNLNHTALVYTALNTHVCGLCCPSQYVLCR